jgi:DNA-binding IclR family transcriptional regulator
MAAEKTTMPGVDAALSLLMFLARQRGPVSAATIQRELDLPRSSTYRLLASMEAHGFVLRLPTERRYGLGLAAYEVGSGFSRRPPLARVATPLLARLVAKVGESAHLSVLHGSDVLYLLEHRAPGRPSLVTEEGVRLPSDITASGRAMLSLLPPQQLRAIFPSTDFFSTRTAEPKLTYWRLRNLLADVRLAGYASENGEVTEGVASVAVGVADHVGWPLAAVALTFDIDATRERRDELVTAARGVAMELGRVVRGRVQTTETSKLAGRASDSATPRKLDGDRIGSISRGSSSHGRSLGLPTAEQPSPHFPTRAR